MRLGNNLLRSTTLLAATCWTQGVPFVMEHPEEPDRPDLPSSWQLNELRRLRTLQDVEFTSFDQCTVGGKGVKPTSLLHGHLPALRPALLACGRLGRCNHPPGAHASLRGRLADGRWNTAPAKTHPEGLCRLLGTAVADAAAHLWPWLSEDRD